MDDSNAFVVYSVGIRREMDGGGRMAGGRTDACVRTATRVARVFDDPGF